MNFSDESLKLELTSPLVGFRRQAEILLRITGEDKRRNAWHEAWKMQSACGGRFSDCLADVVHNG